MMPDNPGDSRLDIDNAARWMTFAELAKARGISKDSAVTLIRRHGWRRQRDNQGHVIALVPLTWASPEVDSQPDIQADNPPDSQGHKAAFDAALAAVREAKDGEITAWRGRAEAAEARAGAAESRAEGLAVERDRERARADTAEQQLTTERMRIEELRGELGAAQLAQESAETEADALRQAEAARRGRGRMRRVWAAWRGQ